MRKLSPIILVLALSPLVQAEPVSEVSAIGKIDRMVSLPVTGQTKKLGKARGFPLR